MTPLPESLLESVAAAAVREGLADAIFTRLSTPLGRLLVVQGPGRDRADRLRERARGRRARPRSPRRSARTSSAPTASWPRPATRCRSTSRATRSASTSPSTCGSPTRRSGAPCSSTCAAVPRGETVSYGELAARAGNPRAARAVGTACALQPGADRRALPPRASRHGPARQLRRRARAQGAAVDARGGPTDSVTVIDLITTCAAGSPLSGSDWIDADLVDHVHPPRDLAEQRVVGRQRLRAFAGDHEELGAARARRLGLRLGHGDDVLVVLEVARRGLDHAVARDRPSRRRPGRRPGSRSPGRCGGSSARRRTSCRPGT